MSDAKREHELRGLVDFFVSDDDAAVASQIGDVTGATVGQNVAELLTFWSGDEELAIDILEIQEIIKVPSITPVPRAASSILGIISLRGTIVPIIDLRRFLGLEAIPEGRETRILVLRAKGDPVGLMVDRVASVQRLERDAIEPVPRTMMRDASEMLDGVGRIGERLLIVLDLDALYSFLERG